MADNSWFTLSYLSDHTGIVYDRLSEHVELTVISVLLGIVISLPLALLARRGRFAELAVIGGTGVIYSVPSIALVTLFIPLIDYGLGLTKNSVVVMLTVYTLLIITRNVITGLAGVPGEVIEAARGMGYSRARILLRVELPLALPVMAAGVRIATVSTVSLVTIGSLVGYGGLGTLILDGFNSGTPDKPKIITGMLLCVLLALLFDLLIVLAVRLSTPWQRARS